MKRGPSSADWEIRLEKMATADKRKGMRKRDWLRDRLQYAPPFGWPEGLSQLETDRVIRTVADRVFGLLEKNPPVAIFANPFRVGGGRKRYETIEGAKAAAERIHQRTGNIVSIEAVESLPKSGVMSEGNTLQIIENLVDETAQILHDSRHDRMNFADRTKATNNLGSALNLIRKLKAQAKAGIHKNPALLGRDRGRKGGDQMSRRVFAVEYKHAEDGKDYRHDFRPGVAMIAEADGNIRLQHHQPGVNIWEDF